MLRRPAFSLVTFLLSTLTAWAAHPLSADLYGTLQPDIRNARARSAAAIGSHL
jgi:hypothetical protein